MRLLPDAHASLIEHATSELPREACGLLALDQAGDICAALATPNSAPAAAEFLIAPADFHRGLVAAEAAGWQLGGVYHSHPGGDATPSPADLAGGVDSGWVYLIVSCRNGCDRVHAYRLAGGRAEGIPVEGCSPAPGL